MQTKANGLLSPLAIIATFAGLAQIASTTSLTIIKSEQIQYVFIWYVMLFPTLLVLLFFITLWFKNTALYAPKDFSDEENFIRVQGGMAALRDTIRTRLAKMPPKEAASITGGFDNKIIETQNALNELKAFDMGLVARELSETGAYSDALKMAEAGLRISPLRAIYIVKARTLRRAGNIKDAINTCSEGIERGINLSNSDSASILATLYFNRACYRELSKEGRNAVRSDLAAAVKLAPSFRHDISSDSDLREFSNSAEYRELMSDSTSNQSPLAHLI